MKPLIELLDISLPPILESITLRVLRGKMMTIIGPNGAGKSTLLKIILGLVKPKTGHIQNTEKIKIGYMPQKIALDQSLPLTVERFLKLSPHKKRTEQALEYVGASSLKARSLHVLSGGEMQRVLLARAIMNKPDLLVLDEPVQGVDISGQIDLYHIICSLKDSLHCGIVLVSHDLHFVHISSDYVICLNQHICCEGHPEMIKENPAYSRLFSNKMSFDFTPYYHKHDHQHP